MSATDAREQALRFLPGPHDAVIPGRIAIAQVHAMLAVAEQQHIANMQTEREILDTQSRILRGPDAQRAAEQARELDRQISERLGLTQSASLISGAFG